MWSVQYKGIEYKTITNIWEEILYQWSNTICTSLTKGNENSCGRRIPI